MGTRIWLIVGGLLGVAVGLGKVPYLAGAAFTLAQTSLRIVHTGGLTLVHDAARHGASRRVVLGLSALVGVLVPGVAAWGLVAAARAVRWLRVLLALLVALVGVVSAVYLPAGAAAGTVVLALAVAGMVVAASGPLLMAPLAGIAGLLAAVYLPGFLDPRKLAAAPVEDLHLALLGRPGQPLWLEAVVLAVAALPFLLAARRVMVR
ncbi:hypothetical protein [Aciditerrimonas ferrireducens]|jgi:hypothetical protein|uniref:hypothetical protein n=1 Tax=Aciditerrimonas ferrireducens TaxID=667306 RepID=UPI00200584FF|nr:hypothetical protein [Aciditerrimonas ferrireducens]MCK4177035.1 hypothetical protein [Aciditerrimonas ferrireducens]